MSVSARNLGRIVRTIWSTQLGLELEECESETLEHRLAHEETIEIEVKFSGAFSGALVQRCSHQVSIMAASCAFSTRNGDLGSTEVRDVLAEIAHMTAGNLKTILPGHSELSFPNAIDPDEDTGNLVAEAGFELQGEPLTVRLISQND